MFFSSLHHRVHAYLDTIETRYRESIYMPLESFKFEDDYEYKILLKVCWRIDKKYSIQGALLYYFSPEK